MIRFLGKMSHDTHHEFYKDSGKKDKRVHVAISGFQGGVCVDLVFEDGEEVGKTLVNRNTKKRESPLVFYVKSKPVSTNKPLTGDLSNCGFRVNQVSRSNRGRMYKLRCTDGTKTALSPAILVMSKKKKRKHVTFTEIDSMKGEIERLTRENKRLKHQNTERMEKEIVKLRKENEKLLHQKNMWMSLERDLQDCSLVKYLEHYTL